MASLEDRRRRALYRATHRGTKEMDWLLGRFAEARVAAMDDVELSELEDFIMVSDPDAQGWLLEGLPADPPYGPLVARIRAFHGLDTSPTPNTTKAPA